MNRLAMLCAVLIAGAAVVIGAHGQDAHATDEVPAAVTTTGGSRLLGMLASARALILRGDTGAQKLDLTKTKSITFGERTDPNLENEARVALGDLQSDEFTVRDKAAARLRSLGRAALKPLQDAAASGDPEVANRAKTLLADMGARNAADRLGDCVTFADGTAARGALIQADFTLRSRWGRLKFPIECLESVELLKPEQVGGAALAPADGAAVAVTPRVAPPDSVAAERLDDRFEMALRGDPQFDVKGLTGLSVLKMDRKPNPEKGGKRTVEVKAGERLEEAYAAWGVLLQPVGANATVQAAGPAPGVMTAQVEDSDCDLNFILPGSRDPRNAAGRAGGVSVAGVLAQAGAAGSVGLGVYDRAGRQLAEIRSRGQQAVPGMPPGAANADQPEFLGVRSKVPIVRVRVFRGPQAKAEPLTIFALCFDRVVSIERPPGYACVRLSSGERLAGQLTDAALDRGMAFRPEFFDDKAAAAQVATDEIERFEPARVEAPAAPGVEKEEILRRPGLGTPHGILLQSGESFRARLLRLDDAAVLFLLPGGVELKLPRQVLRKIDLLPEAPEPGELPPPTGVAEDETPGVDFRRKEAAQKKDEGAQPKEKAEEKKKKDVLQTTQELEPLKNAEILEADLRTGDLKIKDDNGEWTIGMAPVRTLVFPKDPNVKPAAPKLRDWVLTLREGSRFEIALKAISPETVTAEMAGGTVTLPLHVIDSIERQRK